MKKTLFLSLAALALLSACESNNESGSGRTPLSVKITDAPGRYDNVLLNIDKIEVITSSGRTTIDIDENEPFDILEFAMGKDTLLATETVASGRLQEVRLILDDEGNEVVIDGTAHPLTTPSGQSSGVKIKVHDELVPDVAYTMLLDFDVASSITTTGNGGYILKPVIRAIPEAVSGVIRGMILPLDANVRIYAETTEDDRIGAVTDIEGAFYFPGIEDGTYTIIIEPENEIYASQTIEDVEVENGMVKNLGTITLTIL
ncbi:DUF4382 domain-containing protein [Sphingobacterium sp. SGG-5]|uniref:DUF4382 domain-containing protein n=1 Tax=Sphingobacterium sp. SGG-5 TaxID=2710881 RepID=UPI0013ED7805|nr:DUF4382 domain-containing protein [Sphingobacterium sp. SGG-5]NGM62723.1 DUF4382 domain-containing protein [Sphingobacterium sp. SGG-5]